jgi:hypothetical protein
MCTLIEHSLALSAIDGLFLALTSNLTGHFEILQRRIRASNLSSSSLKEIIEYHKTIMDCCTKISESFAILLIGQFIYFIGMICLVGVITVMVNILAIYLKNICSFEIF